MVIGEWSRPQLFGPCHFPFRIINKRVKVRTINPARVLMIYMSTWQTDGRGKEVRRGLVGGGGRNNVQVIDILETGAMCVSRCPFFFFFCHIFTFICQWRLTPCFKDQRTHKTIAIWDTHQLAQANPLWVLCKHSCVGFWRVPYGSATHRKIWLCSLDNYAWPTYGAIAASGLWICPPPPQRFSLSVDDNRSHCFRFPPFTFVCLNCVFGYRIVWV